MRNGTQDKEQHPATGRKLHPKENKRECATRRPMDDETKRLLQNTAVCLRSRKDRLSANRRQVHRKVANKQIARVEKTGNTHEKHYTSYAVRVLLCPFRHGVLPIPLPAGGVCLAHRPLSLKTCGQKVKTPLIFRKISGVFFAPAQLGGKACAARGRSSALVRAIAQAALTRRAQQTVLPQFCTTKSENRDFSC